jgi:hypothetical protein
MSSRKPSPCRLLRDRKCDARPDPLHLHSRRFTPAYRRKRQWVKSLWIGSGLLMILLGAPPGLITAIALGTTFASFCILDETGSLPPL